MRKLVLLLFLTTLSVPAFAVYKCDIDGKTVYRDAPCPGGKEIEVPASGAGTDTQKRLAQDKKQAERLERERHRRETAQAREEKLAARRAAVRKKKCDNLALRKKWADEDVVKSSGKAQERARVKARRAEERLVRECSSQGG